VTEQVDIVVIGAGIAGASAAAELAANARVALLDMEARPGFHATGRSAAFFAPSYGNAVVRGITAASESFYRNPPEGFSDVELIRSRDALFIASARQLDALEEMKHEIPTLQDRSAQECRSLVPILDEAYTAAGLLDGTGGDLDVDAILQGYLRQFRVRGGVLLSSKKVEALGFSNGLWSVQCGENAIAAPIVVNAAGAWADGIAELAGVSGIGLQALKRTAVLIDPRAANQNQQGSNVDRWPLVVDVDEKFYFKPDAGLLLISPADENPANPCDAQPDELDIAIALDRFQTATSMVVKRVKHSWAGLRTFAADRNFVVGLDPRLEGFFWLAGQGGYGVQTAPGVAKLAATLITKNSLPLEYSSLLNYRNCVSPERLL